MNKNPLAEFFHKYITHRPYKGPVQDYSCSLSYLFGSEEYPKVSITTWSLKHLFDRKPAEEFHFILDHLHLMLVYPDKIYKNKDGKRGSLCLVKRIKGSDYLCSIEATTHNEFEIVTTFRIRDSDYIKNYTLLWNRGSGKPHRHALEFPKEPRDAPQ